MSNKDMLVLLMKHFKQEETVKEFTIVVESDSGNRFFVDKLDEGYSVQPTWDLKHWVKCWNLNVVTDVVCNWHRTGIDEV